MQVEENKDDVVEIIEKPEEIKEEIVLEGLDPVEKQMFEKQNPKEVSEPKKDVAKEEVKNEETSTFEDVEKNENLLKSYSSNEKALYWKWKHDKKERQNSQRDVELLTIREKSLKGELEKIRNNENISNSKLKKINDLLQGNSEEITIEALQLILKSDGVQPDNKDRPVTVKDLEELKEKTNFENEEKLSRQKYFSERIASAEEYAKNSLDNYEAMTNLAKEVLEGAVELPEVIDSKNLSAKFVEAINNKEVPIEKLVKYVVDIAKLNPKFGETKSQSSIKKETNENIDRILKNSSKQQTSAAVSSNNSGRRLVSYDDLTIDDAAKLTPDQWKQVPERVRRRLLTE